MRTLLKPVRILWRRLTSMRTALILLFLLAIAAVPGSFLPQKPLNPGGVSNYIKDHGAWGRFLNDIDMFDVFGSAWFAAIYLLLFISLVGCLIPRIRVHAKAVARKPLHAPRNLARLPESGRFETSVTPAQFAATARQVLGRRWRVVERTEDSGALTLSAEKGYSRETGNLLFHVALLVALVLVGIGQLYKYEATRILVQGQGFCNSVPNYDTWKPGRFAAEGKIHPAEFCIGKLSKFTATYGSSGEPTQFAADVSYGPPGSPDKRDTIKVNHPLRIDGDRVYLTGHGFAPTVTVHFPDGTSQTTTQALLPTNATTLYSEGAFKFYGAKTDVGLTAFFAPNPTVGVNGAITSLNPAVNKPILGVQVYTGQINPNGETQSVYSLDTTNLKSGGVGQVRGQPKNTSKTAGANLLIGQTARFANGVTITFDGWLPYANLQISHDPAQDYLLFAAGAMVLGLIGSLGVRRRRVWLRLVPSEGAGGGAPPADFTQDRSPTVVQVGGLARSDSGNFTTEFAALLDRLRAGGPPMDDSADGAVRPDAVVAGSTTDRGD